LKKAKELNKHRQLPLIEVTEQSSYSSEGVHIALEKPQCDETIHPKIKHIRTTRRGIFNCFAFLAYN